jgi:hypothetical protein
MWRLFWIGCALLAASAEKWCERVHAMEADDCLLSEWHLTFLFCEPGWLSIRLSERV